MEGNSLPSDTTSARIELERVKDRLRELADGLSGAQILELADVLHDIIRDRRERHYRG
jgi:hypothetical protein